MTHFKVSGTIKTTSVDKEVFFLEVEEALVADGWVVHSYSGNADDLAKYSIFGVNVRTTWTISRVGSNEADAKNALLKACDRSGLFVGALSVAQVSVKVAVGTAIDAVVVAGKAATAAGNAGQGVAALASNPTSLGVTVGVAIVAVVAMRFLI